MPEAVSVTLDPDGRRVILDEDAWTHIKRRHPLLGGRLREIMATVREPTWRAPGREKDEEWYFSDEALTRLWVQVAVHYEGGEGWIVTAFPRESPQRP